jgi:molybdopterin molybdotransferase
MTEVADAEAAILARMPAWPATAVEIGQAAGRVLAEDVAAERDQPPFDRVTMDGIAIAYADWAAGQREFSVVGTQAAGAPPLALRGPGESVRIMTGAILPGGADAIIPIERIRLTGTRAVVAADADVAARRFVHARGGDRRGGERVLARGQLLGPAEIAVLASAGRTHVEVATLPRVAAIATGDELVGPGEPLTPAAIRSSNEFAIEASLRCAGLATVTRTRLKDSPDELLRAIGALHATHDALILSGGVSMGSFDFVPGVLEALGAEAVFHRIEQKPGRPMWFGMSRAGKPVFALPGNPVSTLVCLTRYVLPALCRAAGLPPREPERVQLARDVEALERLTYFLPVELVWTADGIARAEPRPTNTSGDFVSLAGTDGFVELAPKRGRHTAGTGARLFRW